MGNVAKRWYWKTVNGKRVRVQTKCWYVSYTLAGKTVREKGTPDKRATQILLAQLEEKAARRRAGIPDPHQTGRPLDDLLTEYLAVLESRDTGERHRQTVEKHVAAAMVSAKWQTLADVSLDGLTLHLGRLKKKGDANATLNAHARSVRGFVKWAARKERVADPLAEFSAYNEAVTRRRSRRILTDAELAALLAFVETNSPPRAMPGPERRLLYEVAAYTGFRASELGALTPERFLLAGPCPGIYLPADESKGKAEAIQPLPDFLLARLLPWIAGKPTGRPVWPGRWAENRRGAWWIQRDLRKAGIGLDDGDGRLTNFHSLRRSYITAVVESGATIKEAQELARHSSPTLTFAVYAQASAAKKHAVVNRLRPPGG
jgi:integrase